MTQAIVYDETAIASPGAVAVGPLGVALTRALGIEATGTWDQREAVGSQIIMSYAQSLTAPEQTTALAIVVAHDATAYADIGDATVTLAQFTVDPNPGNNEWADIAGTEILVNEGRTISGGMIEIALTCGGDQGGQTITFDAQRPLESAPSFTENDDARGNINGLRVEIVGTATGGVVRFKRRGTNTVVVTRADLAYRVDLT